jgi:hypothetical protein
VSAAVHEFVSEKNPRQVVRVTHGRSGHLECSCGAFNANGNCAHVAKVRERNFLPAATSTLMAH